MGILRLLVLTTTIMASLHSFAATTVAVIGQRTITREEFLSFVKAAHPRLLTLKDKKPITDLFQEYTVLARLMTTMMDLWIEAIAEMMQRLKDDLPGIQTSFNYGLSIGSVTAVKSGLSDPHH